MRIPVPCHRYQTIPGRLLGILAAGFMILALSAWLFNMLWPRPIVLQMIYGSTKDSLPSVTQRRLVPPGKLTDIAVNDESLFLLYASSGVVMAYSHEGEYQYTILFPYESNGSAMLFASGSDMYYCNRWEKVFYLKSGVYQQQWKLDAGEAKLAELRATDPQHQDTVCCHSDSRYEISGQNVERINSDGSINRIVEGPALLGFLEFTTVWAIFPLGLSVAIAVYFCSIRLDCKLSKERAA